MKDLTNSNIDRQNILNNRFALEKIQEYIGLPGMLFNGEYRFTKEMVAEFFEIDSRTIERYLEQFEAELKHNGYILSKGKQLKEFKLQFAHVINVGSKTTQLGLFNFRSLLNLAMLLKESENAKLLRSKMLDIVIETINDETGESQNTFAILTTTANSLLAQFGYLRMPVILSNRSFNRWINPSTSLSAILSMLHSYPANRMNEYPISTRIIDRKVNEKSLVNPLGLPPPNNEFTVISFPKSTRRNIFSDSPKQTLDGRIIHLN